MDFEALIQNVRDYIEGCKAKNRGKGKVKPFTILLVDTSKKGGKDAGGKKKKGDAEAEAPPKLKEHEVMRLLTDKHQCPDHKVPCFAPPNGGQHYQYTTADLAAWAHMICRDTEGKVNDCLPPAELDIPIKTARQKAIKKDIQGVNEPPKWVQDMMGAMMGGFGLQQQMMLASMHPRDTNSAIGEQSSPERGSPLKRPLLASYPSMTDWLKSLDCHMSRKRPKSLFLYSDLSPIFDRHDIDDLSDLLRLEVGDLTKLTATDLNGEEVRISIGVGNRLLEFANEDINNLPDGGAKRARYE